MEICKVEMIIPLMFIAWNFALSLVNMFYRLLAFTMIKYDLN